MPDAPVRLPWINDYGGQTSKELIALKGKFATGGILFAFERGLYLRGDVALSPVEEVVLAIENLEREVNNGGYGQFFMNSSVKYVPIIVDSLLLIGCPKTAELTHEAIAVLKLDHVTADAVVQRMHQRDGGEERDAALDAIDQRFYQYDTGESVEDALIHYIEANIDQISMPS